MESVDQCAAVDDGDGAGGLGDGDAGGGGVHPAAVDVVGSDGKCAPDGDAGGGGVHPAAVDGTAGTVGGEPVVGTGRDAGVADSLPRRRFPWDEAPVYGDDSEQFSMEIHHNGWFCGVGINHSYMEEQVDTFDGCHRKTFCCALLEWMVKHLGYATPKTGFAMYWCIPGKTIADGLQVVSLETHARAMVAASQENKVLILFIDHNNMLEKQLWDDVVLQKVELPTVISPVKTSYVHEQRGGPAAPTYSEHTNL